MYQHILAATDFSDLGDRALARAADLAIDLGARLTLLHVVPDEDTPSAMFAAHEARALVARLEAVHAKARDARFGVRTSAPPVQVVCEVRKGDAATEVLALSRERSVDLVVVASAGASALEDWLLGSTADRVVRGADRDVLVVREPRRDATAKP